MNMATAVISIFSIVCIHSVIGLPSGILNGYEERSPPRINYAADSYDRIQDENGATDEYLLPTAAHYSVPDVITPTKMIYSEAEDFESQHVRERRSPQDPGKRGSVSVSAGHTRGQFGQPSQNTVRGDYNHNLWSGRNGARLDANAYYQRNWGGGPRQDYGGGLRFSVPLGGWRRH